MHLSSSQSDLLELVDCELFKLQQLLPEWHLKEKSHCRLHCMTVLQQHSALWCQPPT